MTQRSFDKLRALSLLRRAGRIGLRGWLIFLIALLYAPIIVVIGSSFDRGPDAGPAAFLSFPPKEFTFHWYSQITPRMWDAVWFSLKLACATTAAALALGVPAALGLARATPRLYASLSSVCRTPLQIPFIVTGVAFLQFYYAVSAVTGLQLVGTMPGLLIAHVFVATPYVIAAVVVALGGAAASLEDAAVSLGATYPRAVWRVTLPLAMPGVFAGGLYAFLVSFTDVTIAVLLGGAGTATFPVAVINAIDGELDPSVPAVASLVFLVSVLVIALLQKLTGAQLLVSSSRNGG
ncbi:ABC transporter permease [Steroidobacter sp.]|uniref:ABC transporter permease n=1 Tax=Steroidobacter sp. TaxID=1978227 RepID=UPI001A41E371|nr:ABC transporter permease subunit [Steroidobacter sp.]MBL8265236.1 ABC transporter permease subunit [Steroidobacter sp.]